MSDVLFLRFMDLLEERLMSVFTDRVAELKSTLDDLNETVGMLAVEVNNLKQRVDTGGVSTADEMAALDELGSGINAARDAAQSILATVTAPVVDPNPGDPGIEVPTNPETP